MSFAKYKVNIRRSIVFLCTSNEYFENEIKKIPFLIAAKRIKYLEVNLTKEVQDLYARNYQIPLKEIKKDLNN